MVSNCLFATLLLFAVVWKFLVIFFGASCVGASAAPCVSSVLLFLCSFFYSYLLRLDYASAIGIVSFVLFELPIFLTFYRLLQDVV
jgi:hypothetical protein